MFKNVLVEVDGRPTGRDAIALATRLLDPQGKLTLAHVHEDLMSPVHTVAPGVIKTAREVSLELLERERSQANVAGEIISLVSGSPGAALHQHAEEQQADLIERRRQEPSAPKPSACASGRSSRLTSSSRPTRECSAPSAGLRPRAPASRWRRHNKLSVCP
jgi:hypothetical protein